MASTATVTATAAGVPRLLSPTPCSRFAAPASQSISSFSSSRHQSNHQSSPLGLQLTCSHRRGSLHLANARNAPAERMSSTAVMAPSEPEMSAAELKAYEESCAKLDGVQPDFWEGSTWNALGWTIQYMWVFGIVLSVIACITAVRTYNLGATDFKNTEVFKEAIEYQVDGESGSSIFDESTKEAP